MITVDGARKHLGMGSLVVQVLNNDPKDMSVAWQMCSCQTLQRRDRTARCFYQSACPLIAGI
jgi:hypothetical protein